MKQLPPDFQNRISLQLGKEFEDFRSALQAPLPVSIRYNPKKIHAGRTGEPIPWCEYGRYLPERPVFTLDPLLHAGVYYVQEASSMLIEQAFKQISRNTVGALRVLDLCAAPGGKSTHLLSMISNDSLLVSNEVIQSRVTILSENLIKWGHPNCIVTCLDPKFFARLEGFFDIILTDAPCSGEGLFRKATKSINEWTSENAANCALRQKRILHDVLPALKPGGHLIYSTCTYNAAENIDQLTQISKEYPVQSIRLPHLTQFGIEELNENGIFAYQCWPHKVKGEGFFMGILQKTDGITTIFKAKKKLSPLSNKTIDFTKWLHCAEDLFLFESRPGEISVVPKILQEGAEIILTQLPVKSIGTHFFTQKAKNLIPTHDSGLSVHCYPDLPKLELTLEQALQYLRREHIDTEYPGDGWKIVTYQNQPLGWINATSGRLNNKLPLEYRIRNL